jgi:uncharacterized membrane protein (DUF106 family)
MDETETTYESLVTETPKGDAFIPALYIVIVCIIISIAISLLSECYSDFSGLEKLCKMVNDVKGRLLMLLGVTSLVVLAKST